MAATEDIATWIGEPIVTEGGDRVGVVEGIFLDDETADPEWVSVKLGSDGQQRLVPIIAVTPGAEHLEVTFPAGIINSAPVINLDDEIDPTEEHELYVHYGRDQNGTAQPVAGPQRRFRKLGS